MRKITWIFILLLTTMFSWQSNAQLTFDNACTVSFDDISASGAVIMMDDGVTPLDDDGEGNIVLPFAFTLDGVSSTDLRVGNNGGALFGVTTGGVSLGSTPTAIGFYPFADDIDSDYGSVVWETLGTAPNRRVVVMWNDRPHFSNSTSGATFELILHETTNEITFLYQDTDFGDPAYDDAVSAGIRVVGANGIYVYSENVALAGVTCINWMLPTCLVASNLMISNTTTTSADLAWTDNNGLAATDYEYVVQAVGTGVPAGAGTATTANPQPLTGLMGSTQYEVYLRANCGGGDFSTWVKVDFGTACDAVGSFVENFDATANGDVTLCWATVVNSGDAAASVDVQGGAFEFSNAADLASELILVTPELTDLPLDTHRIRFSAQGDTGYAVQIGTMDSPTGTFTPVFGFALTNVMTEYSYSFAASTTNTYVAIKAILPAVNQTIILDDFNWEPIPTCVEPVSLNLSGITGNNVTISWTEMGTATAWEYVVQAAGTGMPAGAGTATATNPVTDTSLAPVTDYEVYVRSVCGAGDESLWIGPATFTTPCVVVNPPYTEAFDTYLPNCWVEASNGDVASGPTDFGSSAWGAEEFAHMATSGLGAVNINLWAQGKSDWLISPQFDLSGGGYEVVLDVAFTNYNGTNQGVFGSDDEVQLLYTQDGVTWNNIQTWSAGNEPSATGETVNFALATTGASVQFALWGSEGAVDDTEDMDFHIDNFKVRIPPTCYEPTDVVASNMTENGATFAWTENNAVAATNWDLYIVPAGDAAPTAASTPTIDDDTTQAPVWTGGMADTMYDVYVRADCGANNTDVSVWSVVTSFRTNCSVMTAPYTEDFEDAGAIDSCWRMSGGEDWNFSNDATGEHIGNNGTITGNTASDNYFAWVDDSFPNNNDVTLTSPVINVDALTVPALYFYLISNNEGNASATLNVEAFDGTTWNNIATLSGNVTEWTNQTIVLTGYTGDIQVRFIVADSGSFYDDIAIDDVVIDEAPSCYVPTALNVTNINETAGTADLSWTDINGTPPANGWEYEIVDITAGGTVTGTGIATATNPVSISGLAAGNEYQFLVRAICGAADQSLWSSTYSWTQIDLPECVSTPMPADMATGISAEGATTFSWVAPITGGTVASYDLYAGTDMNNLGFVTNTTDLTIDLNIGAYATTFYWQVVAVNAGGNAVGCSVWSFTTVDQPGCGETFVDMGGAAGDYAVNSNITYVFTPDVSGEVVTVTFTAFDLEEDYDGLMVYDGPDATFPLFDSGSTANRATCPNGAWTGTTNFAPTSFTSTDASGALTFVFTSDGSVVKAGWEADITCAVAAINDLATVGFNYYPNPVNNNLTMTANENITSVSIFNMLGQEVYTQKLSTLEANIDMSKLSNGTYFVKAQVGQAIGTFKVIKN